MSSDTSAKPPPTPPPAHASSTRSGAPDGEVPREEEFIEDPRFRVMRRLVNLLLIVMIAGFLTIVIALLMKLKDLPSIGVAPLAPAERIVAAEASAGRIALTLRDEATGRDRVVVLDAETFKPIAVLSAPVEP